MLLKAKLRSLLKKVLGKSPLSPGQPHLHRSKPEPCQLREVIDYTLSADRPVRVVKVGATDWSGRTGVILSDGSYDRIERPVEGHIVRMGRVRPLIEYREDRDVWAITQPGGVRFEVSTQEMIGYGASSHDICAFLLEAASRAVWEEEERRKSAVEKVRQAWGRPDWFYESPCDAKAAELARQAMSCESSEEFEEITQKLEGEQDGKG